MKRIILIMVIGFFAISCSTDQNEQNKLLTPFNSVEKGAELVNKNNDFAFKSFSEILKINQNKNTFFSPVSLSLALGMTYNGANGETQQAFENTLFYNGFNRKVINNVNKNLIQHLSDDSSGSVFNVANSIWANEKISVKQNFIDINTQNYYAEIQNLNFSDSNSANIINNWVSDKTNKKIPEIIKTTNPNALMYLINALYFNGIWKYEFDEKLTTKQLFTNEKESKKVDMMFLNGDISYFRNNEFSSIKLPYKNEKFSMTILLPSETKTTQDIITVLNQENWNKWNKEFTTNKVSVSLPKFKFSFQQKLNDVLIDLGLGNAFSSKADFSNISDVASHISFVLQKTFVDVNEKGTEAAAVTVVGIETTAGDSSIPFNANKPFLFLITEKNTNSICFIGKINMPTYEN